MNTKKILSLILLLAFAAILIQSCTQQSSQQTTVSDNQPPAPSEAPSPVISPGRGGISQVPAHYEEPPSADDLKPVLPAAQFTGKTREAYEAVKKIPATIAQMPCYCHCDRGMGHKSLHSCFEDDHAAHCSTCVDEALMAYQLEKRGLSPAQIRERIIAQFGN